MKPHKNSNLPIWLFRLAVLLVLAGQLNYAPDRLSFLRQVWAFAGAEDQTAAARLAYGADDYDLLEWVRRETPSQATILLLTSSPQTYGDPSYVLYHRALYHLYPRTIWWAAPVSLDRYPAWWVYTDLSETDISAKAEAYDATVILAVGFRHPPLSVPSHSFDQETHLIFLRGDH
ncbi:MAG TPA: hypothetical protein VGD99_29110 [Anaerolineae bacterium]|jgi:hypothetical protein